VCIFSSFCIFLDIAIISGIVNVVKVIISATNTTPQKTYRIAQYTDSMNRLYPLREIGHKPCLWAREEDGEYLEILPELRARAVTRLMTAAQGRRSRTFTFQVGFHVPPAQGQSRAPEFVQRQRDNFELTQPRHTSHSIAEEAHMQSLYWSWSVGFEVLTASAAPACFKSATTLSTAAQRPVRNRAEQERDLRVRV
jgi:hypothetical protein